MSKTASSKTLGELFDSGEVQYADKDELLRSILDISDETEKHLANIPFGSIAPIRREGRPKKGEVVHRTTTHTFRFTNAFIEFLKLSARMAHITMTRYIEEAVMLKASSDIALSLQTYKPKQQNNIAKQINYETDIDLPYYTDNQAVGL